MKKLILELVNTLKLLKDVCIRVKGLTAAGLFRFIFHFPSDLLNVNKKAVR